MISTPEITIRPTIKHAAELTVINATPGVMFTSTDHHRFHAFGVIERPRFRMERPYSPDDEWSLGVDPSGALASDIAAQVPSIDSALDSFFERPLDHLSRRLVAALPSGQYLIVRSTRTLAATKHVLLGNVYVPALPHVRVLYDQRPFYAAVFGPHGEMAPSISGLLLGVAVLSYNGDDTLDGIWFFDLHGKAAPPATSKELATVLPLDGPLVVDAVATFRNDGGQKVRKCWLNERGPAFARWLAGDG